VLGVAKKHYVADMLETPDVKNNTMLHNAGAAVSYHDPHVPSFDEHGLAMEGVAYEPERFDCVVIATDHHSIDYGELVDRAQLVVDLRNATGAKGTDASNVFKL
jgi:UDP-N-acetyl-D-glucosamine dehydrogenase